MSVPRDDPPWGELRGSPTGGWDPPPDVFFQIEAIQRKREREEKEEEEKKEGTKQLTEGFGVCFGEVRAAKFLPELAQPPNSAARRGRALHPLGRRGPWP